MSVNFSTASLHLLYVYPVNENPKIFEIAEAALGTAAAPHKLDACEIETQIKQVKNKCAEQIKYILVRESVCLCEHVYVRMKTLTTHFFDM